MIYFVEGFLDNNMAVTADIFFVSSFVYF